MDVTDGDHTEGDGGSLSDLIVGVLEKVRHGLNETIHFGKVCESSDLTEGKNGFDLVIGSSVFVLRHVVEFVDIVSGLAGVRGDDFSSYLGRSSLAQSDLINQFLDVAIIQKTLSCSSLEKVNEIFNDRVAMDLGGTRKQHSLIQNWFILRHSLIHLNQFLTTLNSKLRSQ